jgi:enterochelin esterase-like enzyme
MKPRKTCRRFLATLALAAAAAAAQPRSPLRFEISWDKPLDGRVLLILAHRNPPEPRFQISETLETQQVFGADVDSARAAMIDGSTLGYPRESLDRIPPGDYFVQAVLNVYETFHRADGHTLKLPPDRGEGQRWSRKPGNLYSEPARIRIDPASTTPVRIALTKVIPPVNPPADTKYVRHVRIESKLLSAFWGRPTVLGAVVVVPEGFDEHPDARYPVLYNQGHFAATFTGFRTEPPPPSANPAIQSAFRFYQAWSGGRLPRMLIVLTQDANPYYDDSYAVNSANLGPYGDALIQELYPEVERRFRAIGQPWARGLYGGSTGGWRALALQLFHPDFFNGAWISAPDPIDFRAYSLVNLYEDDNAFYARSEWKQVPVPMMRDREVRIPATMEDALRHELVLGTAGRSGEQFDIWQAVFSPAGPSGYPAPIIDPRTGAIDRKVAEYWKEHYDLVHLMQQNWRTLGPQLAGKLHFTSGIADTYYLERAVRLAQKYLESTREEGKGPYYAGTFEFGPNFGHGAAPSPDPAARTQHERVMEALLQRILETAPAGADLTSWR